MAFASVPPFIQHYGQDVTLRRVTGTTSQTYTDVAVRAFVRKFAANELVGGITQGDRLAIIANIEIATASWPGPPRKGDQIIAGGKVSTVQAVEPVRVEGVVIRHNLTIRGDVE